MAGRIVRKLTEDAARTATCPPGKAEEYLSCAKCPGLQMRVYPTGRKVFVVTVMVAGERKRVTLGIYPAMTLTEARDRWKIEHGRLAEARRETDEERAQRAALEEAHRAIVEMQDRERRREAEAQAAAERLAKARDALTVAEMFRRYLAEKARLKPKTRENTERNRLSLPADWMNKPAAELRAEDVRRWFLDRMAGAPAAADREARTLRAVFNHAMAYTVGHGDERPVLDANPVSAALNRGPRQSHSLWPQARSREEFIPAETLPAFFDLTDPSPRETAMVSATKTMFRLTVFTGLRLGELLALDWSRVDLARGWINGLPGKMTGELDRQPLPPFATELLRWHRLRQPSGDLVFQNNVGKALDEHGRVGKALLKAIKDAAGLPRFGMHDLRRTFSTHAGDLFPEHIVAKLERHTEKDASVTRRHYLKATPDRLQRSAAELEAHLMALAGRDAEHRAVLAGGNVVALVSTKTNRSVQAGTTR